MFGWEGEVEESEREDDRRQKNTFSVALHNPKPWSMDYISLLTKKNLALKKQLYVQKEIKNQKWDEKVTN